MAGTERHFQVPRAGTQRMGVGTEQGSTQFLAR